MSQPPIRTRIEALLQAMSHQLYEKEQSMALVLLSALAGESVFLLGPPGVAKSMMARRLKFAFTEAQAFEYLMGKFSTPDEVFGPVSIQQLKDEDKYERLYENYLPGSNIVFLDEIWKASPPIQNALLTVLNEKIFRNGDHEIRVDLRALIAASNELPLRGEGLEALWDRFLLRLVIDNIEGEEAFEAMLNLPRRQSFGDPIDPALKIDQATYQAWQQGMDEVELPAHLMALIHHLRHRIGEHNQAAAPGEQLYVSDRRWRKVVQLLRAAAYLHGRDEVLVVDAYLIAFCLWSKVEEIEHTQQMVCDAIAEFGYRRLVDIRPIETELEELRTEIEKETQDVYTREEEVMRRFRDDMGVDFVRVSKFWGDGPGYLRLSDLDKLKEGDPVGLPVYEQTGSGFRPFQTINFTREDRFTLQDKSRKRVIDTKTVEREIREEKTAPEGLKRVWNSQAELLLEYCERGVMELEVRRQTDQPHLEGHLFVPDTWAAHTLDSLEATLRDLVNLKLEIQKVQHQYESVEADREGAE